MSEQRFPLVAVLSACALMACGGAHPGPATPHPGGPESVAAPTPTTLTREVPEIRMRLCVLAPDSEYGLRTLQAVRPVDRRDTLAVIGGRRIPLAEAVGAVPVASQASWFAAGRTLDITIGRRLERYAIYDAGRIIPATELAYLGTANGLPVYAAASDMAPVQPAQVWKAVGSRELTVLIEADAAFRARMRAIDVLYVPLRSIGCIFQPLLREPTP